MAKLYVFTGFLGAGKTTLLGGLMRRLPDRRIGVIQNEFGKLGIDGDILRRDGVQLVEINEGSIFCSCLKRDFARVLAEMAAQDFDFLFVESSGLGDPSNMEEILDVVRDTHGAAYDFSGVLCLVDAVNVLDQLSEEETVRRQIRHCHLAVISKADLVSEKRVDAVRAAIRAINPDCRIEMSVNGDLDPAFLEEDIRQCHTVESEASLNREETRPKTLVLKLSEPVPRPAFEDFVRVMASHLYRLKGFIEFENEGWHQIDLVGDRLDVKPCPAKRLSGLTVISKIGPDIIRPFITEWRDRVRTKMELKNR